jgi:hypothetical protein
MWPWTWVVASGAAVKPRLATRTTAAAAIRFLIMMFKLTGIGGPGPRTEGAIASNR